MHKLFFCFCLAALVTNTAWSKDTSITRTEVLLKTAASWDGDALPAYPEGQPEITILRITIPPHTQLPMHKHPVINAGILLKGELTVMTEGKQTLKLKAGDLIAELVNKWHYGKNEGDVPAEIMVFYAGIKDGAITVKK